MSSAFEAEMPNGGQGGGELGPPQKNCVLSFCPISEGWFGIAMAKSDAPRESRGEAHEERAERIEPDPDAEQWDRSRDARCCQHEDARCAGRRSRARNSLAFDAARSRVVLLDGEASTPETWEWDGNDWQMRVTSTILPGLRGHALAYDSARRQTILFGGAEHNGPVAETWRYFGDALATYELFGTGCAGSAGTPTLVVAAGQRPWLGELFAVQVQQLPLGSSVWLSLGLSNTAWLGVPLPFDLGAIGMPGCTLLASGEIVAPLFNIAGTATWNLPICKCPGLLGGTFHNQAIVLDRAANLLGFTTSQGAMGRVGWR